MTMNAMPEPSVNHQADSPTEKAICAVPTVALPPMTVPAIVPATIGAPAARLSSRSPALHIILDEMASNIVKHSGAAEFGLSVIPRREPEGVELVFSDDGKPFDPLARAAPDTTLPAEKRPIGGLGIMMVRKMSSSVSYRRVGGHNEFSATVAVPRM